MRKNPHVPDLDGRARAWASATILILVHRDSLSTFGHLPTPTRSGRRPKGRNWTFLGGPPSYTMRVTEADDCSAVARIFSAVISS